MHKIIWALFLGLLSNLASAGTPLTVAVYPGLDEAVKIAIPLYRKLHPEVEIQLVSLPFKEHYEAMSMALSTGENLPDVMGVDPAYVHFRSMWHFENLRLPSYGIGKYRKNFYRAVTSVPSDDYQYFIQASAYPKALLYREDLLHKAGLGEKDLTGSWESFVEAGKKLKAVTGACLVSDAVEVANLYVHARTKEKQGYYRKSGKSCTPADNIKSPVFEKAFELALAANQADIDCKSEAWSDKWKEGLKRSEIAGVFVNTREVQEMGTFLSSNANEKWRVAQLPESSFVLDEGDFYAIPSKALHKHEAWDFLKFLTMDAEVQKEWARKTGAFPTLRKIRISDALSPSIPLLGGQNPRQIWQDSLEKSKPHPWEPHFESESVFIVESRKELGEVFEGKKTILSALQHLTYAFGVGCRR